MLASQASPKALGAHLSQAEYGWSARAFQTLKSQRPYDGCAPFPPPQVNRLGCCRPARSWASTAATAVMFNTPRAVTDGVRICAGREGPIRIGPTGTASVSTFTI